MPSRRVAFIVTERRCPECARGQHSRCTDYWIGRSHMTCACRWCETWEDEHGPNSVPGNEPEPAT